jgi:hypothetical protein
VAAERKPVGDPSSAPRCGARTQCGTACQCPAIRGRRRCRLHGRLSTGPRTVEGLARIRQANTRHGRFSREQVELARLMREFQMNGIKSARAMRSPSMRAHFLQVAFSETVPSRILEQMREMVRVKVARQDYQRRSPGEFSVSRHATPAETAANRTADRAAQGHNRLNPSRCMGFIRKNAEKP